MNPLVAGRVNDMAGDWFGRCASAGLPSSVRSESASVHRSTARQASSGTRKSCSATLLGLALLIHGGVRADDPAPPAAKATPAADDARADLYRAAGTPAAPKVDVRWNVYHDYDQATELLKRLVKAHPDLARLQSLGKSHEGREMWLLTITDTSGGQPDEKPAFWIDGGIHANEIQASEVVLYTAWWLCEMHADTAKVKELLSERTFYLVPMMSPDSRQAHFDEPNTTHSPRSGQVPIDDDDDGRVDEDKPNDLDGDGSITTMRVRDPKGDYKSHPKYPNLMVRVEPGEVGEFRLIGTEGIDDDGDGQVNEDGDGSYDPNRDWAWAWQPGYVQRGALWYPFTLVENRVVADFVRTHPRIAGAQSYHNSGGMILRGPGVTTDEYPRQDIAVYDRLAAQGQRMLPGYKYLVTATGLYEVFGGELEWMHQRLGIFCFTNELFTPFNFFREPQGDGGFFGRSEVQYEFDKLMLLGDGITPWTKVTHPTYGEVEVGGPNKRWVRQPPGFLLEEECHRNMAFTLYHADQLPRVRVTDVTTKPLAGGVTAITATVENTRITPTHSQTDLNRKITRPDEVTLDAAGATVLATLTDDEPLFDDPTADDKPKATVKLPNLPGQSVRYVRWLVAGDAAAGTVTVDSVKGGRHAAALPGKK